MITRYFNQQVPRRKYTTIQFNKNYATKMHVDGNNEGPSYIVGFGDYTGGQAWIYDPEEPYDLGGPGGGRSALQGDAILFLSTVCLGIWG